MKVEWISARGKKRCFFQVSRFFTLTAVLLVLNSRVAPAQINTYDALSAAIETANDNAVICIDGNIDFSNTAGAIIISKTNVTLQGKTSSNFANQIATLSDSIVAQGNSITSAQIKNSVDQLSLNVNSMSAISATSGGNQIRKITEDSDEFLTNKWLTTPSAAASAANGLSLKDIRFDNVKIEYDGKKITNGLIGNSRKALSDTSMKDITGNAFTGINVTLKGTSDLQYLAGGGIIGVRATGETLTDGKTASATMNIVSGNYFNDVSIITTEESNLTFMKAASTKSAYLEGGGLIGVNAVSSPDNVAGHSNIEQLNDNLFTNVKILSNDIILGGGLVGANNNSKRSDSQTTYARINTASGNVFGNGAGNTENNTEYSIDVKAGYSLRGGGVIGLNGLSTASVELNDLTNNVFAGISVETGSYIRGGGIVGLQTNDGGGEKTTNNKSPDSEDTAKFGDTIEDISSNARANIGNASGNVFLNQKITVGSYLQGGGVIGLRSNAGIAELDTLKDNVFKDITVTINGNNDGTGTAPDNSSVLSGGGIVGLSSVEYANLGSSYENNNVYNNYFDNIKVNVNGLLNGGGIIGVHASDQSDSTSVAVINGVAQNIFANSSIKAVNINGGGIIGANTQNSVTSLGTISGNMFEKLNIDVTETLTGGGVLGVITNQDEESQDFLLSTIDTISNNTFQNVKVTSGKLVGGGIVGLKSSGVAYINRIVNNQFLNNEITAKEYIDGGGIIGVTGSSSTDPLTGIGLIDQSVFKGNKISAENVVMGGIVYSYGVYNGMTIRDSQFLDNTMSSENGIVYGTVTVDTGTLVSSNPYALTLEATSGKSVVFQNNTIEGESDDSLKNAGNKRSNSLYFGTIPNVGETLLPSDPSQADAKLIVAPQAGGLVALYDPIWVNQDEEYTFDMDVTGSGNFLWGGTNVMTTKDQAGTINLKAGSATTILDGNSTTTFVNGQGIANAEKNTMSLNAPNFTFRLENGATLNVEGHNVFDLSNNVGNAETKANLNGRLHFNLNNTEVYHQGELPGVDYFGNAAYSPLLTIKTPANQNMVDLNNSVVLLSDFGNDKPLLTPGDRFYLIEVQNGTTNDPDNRAFTDANPSNSVAYARRGLTVGYTFIIDKNLDNLGVEENTRFLVARLQSRGPAEEFEPPTTDLTFLQRGSDRLANLPLYEIDPCSPCSPCGTYDSCDPCRISNDFAGKTGWIGTPWAMIEGAWYRVNGNAYSYADVRGALFFGGFSVQRRIDSGRIFLGAFVDVGDADYGTFNDYSHAIPAATPQVRGGGKLDSLGGGVFLRRKWNGGLRFDAMFRGGNLKNKFISHDLITNGVPAHFQLDTAYWGTNVGFDYEWRRGRNTFDVYSRYLWLMKEAQTGVPLSTDETVDFQAVHSHRIYSGGRLTRQWKKDLSWYLGAAYEYELDGTARAVERSSNFNFAFEAPSLRGGTGIGELGFIYRRTETFHAVFGLEGYLGKREGGTGSIAAVWKW
ncbi:MAG: autotransporter outer membrane beta-barrel domain-containing protein [Planctomycetaceae bacterium]|jgi:hypothetical protein|nr:autotransporter outer membrane beta-barrel domain-containing protein [Planctomycetaceae bacterium]